MKVKDLGTKAIEASKTGIASMTEIVEFVSLEIIAFLLTTLIVIVVVILLVLEMIPLMATIFCHLSFT